MRMRQETFKKSYYIPAFGKSIEIRRNQDIDEEGVLGKELLAQYGEDCILEGETKSLMEKVASGDIGGGVDLTPTGITSTQAKDAIYKAHSIGSSASEIDGQSIYELLSISRINNKQLNMFLTKQTDIHPLVSSVNIDAEAFVSPKTYAYTDVGGYDRIRMIGFPYKDTSTIANVANGYVSARNPSLPTGTDNIYGMKHSENLRGGIYAEFTVTCSSVKILLKTYNLSSIYFPIWVDGIAVSPAVTASTIDHIQINFAVRGTYTVIVGLQESVGIKGVVVSEDDTVHPVRPRLSCVAYGDSYIQGTVSPQLAGTVCLAGAISHIGGINCIPSGASGTGYINDAGIGFPMTFNKRLQYTADLVNNAKSKIIIIPAGYNDVSLSATASAMNAAVKVVANYFLENTDAYIVLFGSLPGNRNNSIAQQNVDLGIKTAVDEINNKRIAFVPVSGALAPWITGTRSTSVTTGGVAGNSRFYTGNDNIHPSPYITANPNTPSNSTPSSGVEYIATRILDSISRIAYDNNWRV